MDTETPERLRMKASRYRDMSQQLKDDRALAALLTLADKYEAFAEQLERSMPDKKAAAKTRIH